MNIRSGLFSLDTMANLTQISARRATYSSANIVPRLGDKAEFLRPEYAGVNNSGRRPTIMRRDGWYIVGPAGSVERMLPSIRARRSEGVFKDWRTVSHSNLNVFVFKHRKPAVAKFAELCKQVLEWNRVSRIDERRPAARS
jgi:hypothetical protein